MPDQVAILGTILGSEPLKLIPVAHLMSPVQELLDKCHPLGMFDSIATLAVASSMRELYRLVLVDTPLAPYFSESLSAGRLLHWSCDPEPAPCSLIWSGESAFLTPVLP